MAIKLFWVCLCALIAGHGTCDCGKCLCDDDWFGEACQYQENCKLSKRKSKDLCRNAHGVVCSNAGEGECIIPTASKN